MSRATKLMKLRRRPGSTHWCPMPRYRCWEIAVGGYTTLVEGDPWRTAPVMLGQGCNYIGFPHTMTMTSTDELTVTYTLRYED